MWISSLGLAAILLATMGADDRLEDAGCLLLLLGLAEILAAKIPQEFGRWRRAAAAAGLGAILGVISSAMFNEAGLPIGAVAAVVIYCYSKKPNRPHTPITWDCAGFIHRVKKIFSPWFRQDPPSPTKDY
jgi:hypothetical protein